MKQNMLEMVQVTILFHTDELIFVWSFKNGNGRQNRSSGTKSWLLRRVGAKTQFPGDTRNVAVAGVVYHFCLANYKSYEYIFYTGINIYFNKHVIQKTARNKYN